MNIRYLKIFLAVVDEKTMSGAAKALHMTQPSISQAIMEMENYYNVRLFDRLSKKLYLTNTGIELLPYARHIVSTFDNMEVTLKNSAAQPIIRYGGTAVFSTCFLPEIVHRIEASPLQTQVQITVTNTPTVERLILNSGIDIGVVEGTISHPDIISTHLLTDRIIFVCGKSHHLYGKTIQVRDLDGEEIISREGFSYLTGRVNQLAQQYDLRLNQTWQCSGNEAILAAVNAGHGITIVSACFVEKLLQRGELFEIPISDLSMTREMSLVYHKNKFISPALEDSIRITKEYAAEVILTQRDTTRYVSE